MQKAHIKGGRMADTFGPGPDGVGILDRDLPGKKKQGRPRRTVQATAGNDNIGLTIGQVLCGERAKSRVEWQGWRGEWRRRGRLLRWPGEGVLLYGFVVGVEGGFEEEDGGDAASHFLHIADFVLREGAAEQRLFAVGKPLLDDLVASDGVFPNSGWDVGPVGGVI